MFHQMKLITLVILVSVANAARRKSLVDRESGASSVVNFRHFRELAAQGSDLQAWRAAVDMNAATAESSSTEVAAGFRGRLPKAWLGKFRRPQVVGEGAFGKVYVAKLKCSDDAVALKAMKTTQKEADAEADLLKLFSDGSNASPHFISYFDHDVGGDRKHYIMMEAAMGKTLAKIIEGSVPSSTADKYQLFFDMLEGVAQMHDQGIVHRDLKPANVMISRLCTGSVPCHAKVGDLGLACCSTCRSGAVPRSIPRCRGVAGTPLYIAPETYAKGIVDEKNDVWALGLMLYEIVFGRLPDAIETSRSMQALERNIQRFQITSDRRWMSLKGGPVKDLIEHMVALNLRSRWTAREALALASDFSYDDDTQGFLPWCFDGGATPPVPGHGGVVVTEPVDEPPADDGTYEDDIDFFTIRSPMTNVGTNYLFNPEVVDPTSGVVSRKVGQVKKYLRAPLKPGYVILEVNDITWAFLTDEKRDQLKQGVLGPLVFKYMKT